MNSAAVIDQGNAEAGAESRERMSFTLSSLPLPARLRLGKPMSDDELLRFCAENEGLHIERQPDGELVIMSPAVLSTFRMNERISRYLGNWAEEDGRGTTGGPDAGYRLPDGSMRSPDASWFLSARAASYTAEEQAKFPPICPEFVREKMEMWMANGAELAWLIEPEDRKVTIYRQGGEPEVLFDPTSVQGTGPVRGFELVMGRVWGEERKTMGLNYVDLDPITRLLLKEELAVDIGRGNLYQGKRLTSFGLQDWPSALQGAFDAGNDMTLQAWLSQPGRLETTELYTRNGVTRSRSVPATAAQTFAEGEFNRFYIRAICRKALQERNCDGVSCSLFREPATRVRGD